MKAEHSANEVESVRLFNEVAERYGDLPFPGGVKNTYGEFARGGAFAVKNLGLGKPALTSPAPMHPGRPSDSTS